MSIVRLARQGTVGQCSCKVGGCWKCGSVYQQCKCVCNGISPLDILCRRVGKRRNKSYLVQDSVKDKNDTPKKRKLDENKDKRTWRVIWYNIY